MDWILENEYDNGNHMGICESGNIDDNKVVQEWFTRWEEGRTGYLDALMRQLKHDGSILIDHDPTCNIGNWYPLPIHLSQTPFTYYLGACFIDFILPKHSPKNYDPTERLSGIIVSNSQSFRIPIRSMDCACCRAEEGRCIIGKDFATNVG